MRAISSAPTVILFIVLGISADASGQTVLTNGDSKISPSQPNATAGTKGWLHETGPQKIRSRPYP
jgi:hypothetical protein